jgi:hypothetical protein
MKGYDIPLHAIAGGAGIVVRAKGLALLVGLA